MSHKMSNYKMLYWEFKAKVYLQFQRVYRLFFFKTTKQVFTEIHNKNIWRNPESRSGWGSTIDGENGTAVTRAFILTTIKELEVNKIVDLPCGDFNWMKEVDLADIKYVGIDIVPEVVRRNQELYGSTNIIFQEGNLVEEVPPLCDLLIVRDLLIHLSTKSILGCLKNILKSKAKYVLISNYSKIDKNQSTFDGGLCFYNLYKPPFNEVPIPASLSKIVDGDGNRGRELLLIPLNNVPTIR